MGLLNDSGGGGSGFSPGSPGPIGSGTPNTGAFTTATATVQFSGPSTSTTSATGLNLGTANTGFYNNAGSLAVSSGGSAIWTWGSGITTSRLFTQYGSINTAGKGLAIIVGAARSVAQTAAVASVATFTVGAADGSFEVSANVLVTVATAHSFSVTVAYTDEGNTARTLTLPFTNLAGSFSTLIANAGGAVPYESPVFHIRAKAATAITIATSGTFTTVTYNVDGVIKQTA